MMPKSTAMIAPSSATNKLPGCRSAWKNPSRNACRKKMRAMVATIRAGSCPAAMSAARSSMRMPETRSAVSTRRPVRGQSMRGTRKLAIAVEVLPQLVGRGGLVAQIHLELDRGGEDAHDLDRLEPTQSGPRARHGARHGVEEIEIAGELRLDAGPQHLDHHRLVRRPSSLRAPGRWRPRPPARSSNDANSTVTGLPSSASMAATRLGPGKWRQPILQ